MADQMNRFKDPSAKSANVKKLYAGQILREYKLRATAARYFGNIRIAPNRRKKGKALFRGEWHNM